ncbi:hypothetical protein PV08_09378 [Exophiala spinifera]|uniref:Uncharacterized protein n=1 Tax=Exophiala spinifera TaxID=91928 RepID=A0A0D2BLQ3_9EURO|nr:uncharacterized protein PV08_09378 [Exophiala spinifera]KIW12104.1 hypothetical protein PV08_09378 [Exophiala spinifera]
MEEGIKPKPKVKTVLDQQFIVVGDDSKDHVDTLQRNFTRKHWPSDLENLLEWHARNETDLEALKLRRKILSKGDWPELIEDIMNCFEEMEWSPELKNKLYLKIQSKLLAVCNRLGRGRQGTQSKVEPSSERKGPRDMGNGERTTEYEE